MLVSGVSVVMVVGVLVLVLSGVFLNGVLVVYGVLVVDGM